MRKLITLLTAAVLAIAVFTVSANAATGPILELPSTAAPGIRTLYRLDFKVDERQYAFTHKCASFDNYTGIRARGVSCDRIKRYVEHRSPAGFNCFYFGLRLSYRGVSGGDTIWRSDVTRIDCNRNSDGAAFAVTARRQLARHRHRTV